jgi:hypothetical protein
MSILREGLLNGRSVMLAGASGDELDGLADALRALGATVTMFDPVLDEAGEGGADWVRARGPFHALVHDASSEFGHGGPDTLATVLQDAWIATAALANGAFIPGGEGGKLVLLAPVADAGPHAGAARDALENLARTLSTEWARYGITATAIAPAEGTEPEVVATLVAFVVSTAGDYFSGCRFDLGSAGGS